MRVGSKNFTPTPDATPDTSAVARLEKLGVRLDQCGFVLVPNFLRTANYLPPTTKTLSSKGSLGTETTNNTADPNDEEVCAKLDVPAGGARS
jgi:hypothetical protein